MHEPATGNLSKDQDRDYPVQADGDGSVLLAGFARHPLLPCFSRTPPVARKRAETGLNRLLDWALEDEPLRIYRPT